MTTHAVFVTVVVPTRDRAALLGETLRALRALDYPAFEIVIVDQSVDETARDVVRRVAGHDPRVRVERARPDGSAAARNVGVAAARGTIVAFTDDDCIVERGWLRSIAAELSDPHVSAVYGRVLPYEAGPRTGREVGFKPTPRRVDYVRRVPPWHIGHGGNMAFCRAALLEIGGFDILLGAGGRFGAGEDGDIAYRLLAAGKRVVYSPHPLAYHRHWKDWPAQRRMERAYGVGIGAQCSKYVRRGDLYGLVLLWIWMWQLGVRRFGAGLLKWRSVKVVYLSYCQLVYPWLGIVLSLRHPIDHEHMVYKP